MLVLTINDFSPATRTPLQVTYPSNNKRVFPSTAPHEQPVHHGFVGSHTAFSSSLHHRKRMEMSLLSSRLPLKLLYPARYNVKIYEVAVQLQKC